MTGQPDFSNDKADFWIDRSTTNYLKTGPTGDEISELKDYTVLEVKIKETGEEAWVIHDGKNIVAEAKRMSDLATLVDMTKTDALFREV